jgi:hypothetical protein
MQLQRVRCNIPRLAPCSLIYAPDLWHFIYEIKPCLNCLLSVRLFLKLIVYTSMILYGADES